MDSVISSPSLGDKEQETFSLLEAADPFEIPKQGIPCNLQEWRATINALIQASSAKIMAFFRRATAMLKGGDSPESRRWAAKLYHFYKTGTIRHSDQIDAGFKTFYHYVYQCAQYVLGMLEILAHEKPDRTVPLPA